MYENLLVIPLVLAFNSKIAEVCAQVEGRSQNFRVVGRKPVKTVIENVKGETVTVQLAEETQEHCMTVLSEANLSVASFHNSDNNINNLPRLFFAFPLLDSRRLGIQFFINSESFDVRPEREDINLGKSEDAAIKNNKHLLDQAFALIPELLKILKEQGVGNLHRLIRIRSTDIDTWDNEWLRNKKLELVESFLEAAIICSAHWQGYKTLKELVLAIDECEETAHHLHELLRVLYPDSTPEWDLLKHITTTIDHYVTLGMTEDKMLWEVERLCKYVQDEKRLSDSGMTYKFPNAEKRWEWLNSFYKLVKQKDRKLLSEYAVVLNQKGDFVHGSNNIRTDGVNDEELLNISTLLNKELRENLIEQKLTTLNDLYTELSQEQVVGDLVTALNSLSEEEYSDGELRLANARMLKWLISQKDINRIKAYQILVSSKSGIVKKAFDTGAKHKLLAPRFMWSDTYPLFAELVRSSDCMHDCYVDLLDEKDLIYLEDNKCIVRTPLIKKTEKLNKSDLPRLLLDKSDLPRMLNQQAEMPEIELNDFVFFTSSEGHIFKNRQQSIKGSLDILRFVLREAIVNDSDYNKVQNVEVEDGTLVQLRKSLWVGRLQEIQWVCFTKDSSSTEVAETGEIPSSYNIARMIEKDEELKELVKNPASAELLGIIGVSVADLIRSLLPNRREQVDWDKAFMKLLTAGLSAEDANKMLNDDKTVEEFRKRERNRRLIKRNQDLGFGFEAKFKELVEGIDPRFNVERKPFGSDFIIEDDFLITEGGEQQEILFGFMDKLIELKVTGRDYAAMTPLQAKTAVENQDDFVLVVLEVGDSELLNDTILDMAKAVDTIGNVIQEKYAEYTRFTSSEAELVKEAGQVQINISEGGDIRFRVKPDVWRYAQSLREYLVGLLHIQ